MNNITIDQPKTGQVYDPELIHYMVDVEGADWIQGLWMRDPADGMIDFPSAILLHIPSRIHQVEQGDFEEAPVGFVDMLKQANAASLIWLLILGE
jgi:hypothetical protein